MRSSLTRKEALIVALVVIVLAVAAGAFDHYTRNSVEYFRYFEDFYEILIALSVCAIAGMYLFVWGGKRKG